MKLLRQDRARPIGKALFLSLALLIVPTSASAAELHVTEASLEARPTSYAGPCPGVIKFKGKITTDGPGVVKYTFTRSDGATGPIHRLDFATAGSQEVETDWTLGDSAVLPHYEGWQTIRILAPNELESNRAKFVLDCTTGSAPNPQPQHQPAPGKPANSLPSSGSARAHSVLDQSIKLLPQNFPQGLPEKLVSKSLLDAHEVADAISLEEKAVFEKQWELQLRQLPNESTRLSAAMQKSKDFQTLQSLIKKALDTKDPWPQIRDLEAAYLPQVNSLANQLALDPALLRQVARPIGAVTEDTGPQDQQNQGGKKDPPAQPLIEPRTIVLTPPLMSVRQDSHGEGLGGTGHSVHLDENTGNFDAEAWSSTYVGGRMDTRAEFEAGLVTMIPPGYQRAEVLLTIRPQRYEAYATALGGCVAAAGTEYMVLVGESIPSTPPYVFNEYNRYRYRHFGFNANFLASGSETRTETMTIPIGVSVRPAGQRLTFMLKASFYAYTGGFICGATSRILISGRIESVTINLVPE